MLRMTLNPRSTLVQQVISSSSASRSAPVSGRSAARSPPSRSWSRPSASGATPCARRSARWCTPACSRAAGLRHLRACRPTSCTGVVARKFGAADPEHTVEVRRAFEVEAARLAALRRTPEDLDRARRGAGGARRGLADRRARRVRRGRRRPARRRGRRGAQPDAGRAVRLGRRRHPGLAWPSRSGRRCWPAAHIDHARLVDAIRAGDPDRAAHEAGKFLEAPRRA